MIDFSLISIISHAQISLPTNEFIDLYDRLVSLKKIILS